MFILEHAVQDQELLAAIVNMRGEVAGGCVADDGRGARHFRADPVEQAPMHARHGGWHPIQAARMDCRALTEIRVQVHRCPPVGL